jgi:hypothetical protein
MRPLLHTPSWEINAQTLGRNPLAPGVRYWSAYTWGDVIGEDHSRPTHASRGRSVELLPANMGMYAGADLVQGYSPMHPLGISALFRFGTHGQAPADQVERILRRDLGPDGLLRWMAVDGLMLGESLSPLAPLVQANGWLEVANASEGSQVFRRPGGASGRIHSLSRVESSGERDAVLGRLWHRAEGPAPVVLYRPGAPAGFRTEHLATPKIEYLCEERNRAVARIGAAPEDRESVVVFSRPWFPGYRAWLDGKPVGVEVFALTMPAVRLPAGASGELILEYRPAAVTWGGVAFAAAVGFVAFAVGLAPGSRKARFCEASLTAAAGLVSRPPHGENALGTNRVSSQRGAPMASYRGHLMLSAPLGAAYGGLALLRPEFDWGPVCLGAGLTTVGGLLPDLDSDSGVPVRELFGITAAAVAVLLLGPLRANGLPLEQALVFMGVAYFFIRYVVSAVFKRWTVHRGMFHSIPAMFIAGLLVFLAYPNPDPFLRLYLAGGVMAGFLSHLILDEFYAVDFMGARLRFNKFAGSALKFHSPSWGATLCSWLLLGLLGYVAWMGVPDWARLPAGWQRPSWLGPDRHAQRAP